MSTPTRQTGKNKNLFIISINNFLGGLGSMTQAVWQPFVLSLGAPMHTLGLLESVGGFRGIVTALVYPISGWLSDRLGRKPLMAFGYLSAMLAFALYVLAGVTGNWHWLVPGIILFGISFTSNPAFNSLVAESVQPNRRGTAFSIVMVAWTIPAVVAPSLGGLIADRWRFTPVFVLRCVLDFAALMLIFWFLKETLSRPKPILLHELKRTLFQIFVPPNELRGLYLAMVTDRFAWGLGLGTLFGMLSETHGFTTWQLGVMSSALSLVIAIAQMPIGQLVDRYGSRPSLIASEVLGILSVGGWILSTSFYSFTFWYALFGLSVATWVPAQMSLLANSIAESERGEAIGRLSALQGILGAPAPFLGSLLYERFGFQVPLLANMLGIFIPLLLFIFAVKEPALSEFETATS